MSVKRGGPPLADLRVIDLATVLAGPGCARYLADFGADVIKVERPGTGDTLRSMGWRDPADDVTLFWKLGGRGKRSVGLDLQQPEGVETLRRLIITADVLVENFRPGKLEALGLVPDELIAENPGLVITRVTGFGQDGPYARRPGFATMAAVHSGIGQVVDVNLLESMLQLMGPLVSAFGVLGVRAAAPRLRHRLHRAPQHLPLRSRWPSACWRSSAPPATPGSSTSRPG